MRILIAGISTRAIAESAARSGYSFLTLDYFGDRDQQQFCQNHSLRHDFGQRYGPAQLWLASRKLGYDALVYTASLENHPAWVDRMASGAERRVLGNGGEVLRRARHWPAFFGVCERLGWPGPLTFPAGEAAPAGTGCQWLRKPVRSGGGRGVARWPESKLPGRAYYVQEYVPGPVCSVAFVAAAGQAQVLGMSEQMVGLSEFGADGFTYCGNIFPLSLSAAEGAAVLEQARKLVGGLAAEFGLAGLNGLDFILNEGRIRPLELNPRYTASMELVERATGIGIFAAHVRACSEPTECQPVADLSSGVTPAGFHGKAILYAERDCRAPDTSAWMADGVRDIPQTGEAIPAGSPVCTVLANGPSPDACRSALLRLAEDLKGELYA